MRRNATFTHQGCRYRFLDWALDGSARCVDLNTNSEVWLTDVALDPETQRDAEKKRRDADAKTRRERRQRQSLEVFNTGPGSDLMLWARLLELERRELEDEIADSGGKVEVPVLCDLKGNEISAKNLLLPT